MSTLEWIEGRLRESGVRTVRGRDDVRMALVITRREVRDSFRDWRIIIPIVILTLLFPLLMNFTAGRILNFVTDFGAEIIGIRLIPFLLLVVGFFPTSFSLVIALETFVGEKERNSLEPLLATPLSNVQIYLGKMLASLIPPLFASYLGISVYLFGLWYTVSWTPSSQLFLQTVALTTVQGVVMVAAAVIVSSQTTSTRAANLLASFIIVPMALLVQFEAVVMFWGNHEGLWWLIFGLIVVAIILVRTGIHVFNREELLGRDIDHIRLGWALRTFWRYFSGKEVGGAYPGFANWFRHSWGFALTLRKPLLVVLVSSAGAILFGLQLADVFTLSREAQELLRGADMVANLSQLEGLLEGLPLLILVHNLRVVVLAVILGIFTFGVLGLAVFMLPWTLISYLAAQLYLAGGDPFAFVLATIAPHGIVEFPVVLLLAAAALRWHAVIISPPRNGSITEQWIRRWAEFTRLFIALGAPLLLAAALLEAYVTPLVVRLVYG